MGLLAVCSIVGCSSSSNADRSVEISPERLARQMRVLPLGVSVDAAEGRVGQPRSRFPHGEEVSLLYGRWHLVFEDGVLVRKIRYCGSRPKPRYARRSVGALIQRLPGEALKAIEEKVGPPEDCSEMFEEQGTVVIYSYGDWELSFEEGRLQTRTKWG